MKRILQIALLALLGISASTVEATTYYVSNSGNDSNVGTSEQKSWQTIAKVNKQTLKPGDQVLFKCGDTWRNEELRINNSGTVDAYIKYASYGKGEKPQILGSLKAEKWAKTENKNVWKSVGQTYSKLTNKETANLWREIFFIKTNKSGKNEIIWGDWAKSTQTSALAHNLNWVISDDKELYVYYDGDMNTSFNYVEVPMLQRCALINNVDYISLDNLELAYTITTGIRSPYPFAPGRKGLKITNCHVHHVEHKNSSAGFGIYAVHSDAYYGYNEIHDCGRRSLSLTPSLNKNPITMTNVVIENNHFHSGWHTTGVDIISSVNDHVENIVIRNNYFQGNPEMDLANDLNAQNSNHMFIKNAGKLSNKAGEKNTSYLGKVRVYNNVYTFTHGKSVAFVNVDDSYVVNNTFYGSNPTTTTPQRLVSLSEVCERNVVKNNIFYNNTPAKPVKSLMDFMISYDAYALGKNVTIDNNIHFAENPAQAILNESYGVKNSAYTTPAKLIEADKPWRYTYSDWSAFVKHFSCPKSKMVNPQFVDVKTQFFKVKATSPAVGNAEPIEWVKTDFYGNPRNPRKPTIGAIEFIR